jgi:NAD(P)-dependent dehydrogenase (short-subunit alcohol dehydrogenase family)
MDLTNAAAIVTGGAGGVGSATVRRLAQMGATVVIAAVSDKRGEALAREAGGRLGDGVFVHAIGRHVEGAGVDSLRTSSRLVMRS